MRPTIPRSWTHTTAASLIVCLVSLVLYGASLGAAVPSVPWCATSPIGWHLFQCTPPSDAVHRSEAAAIHMTIDWHAKYSLSSNGGDWTGQVSSVTVTNTMQPALSWVVPGKGTTSVLSHEQTHFDLNEVYRRKLEAVLPCLQARHATKQGVIDALNAAIHRRANEILAQLEAAQARYDAETRHGQSASAQARWESQIAGWLSNPTAAP